jgi:hypothetical protein
MEIFFHRLNAEQATLGMILFDQRLVPSSPAIHQDHPFSFGQPEHPNGMPGL